MTKEAYYEMCDMLGTEPNPDEIPIEFSDLNQDVQEAMNIYSKLRDEWDTMNGNYMGKNYSGILDIFNILDVQSEDRRTVFELIGLIDNYRSKAIKENKQNTTK